MKYKLHDIRESKVWKEAYAEGKGKAALAERARTVRQCFAKGMTEKQIADLLEISVAEIRRLANEHPEPKRP